MDTFKQIIKVLVLFLALVAALGGTLTLFTTEAWELGVLNFILIWMAWPKAKEIFSTLFQK